MNVRWSGRLLRVVSRRRWSPFDSGFFFSPGVGSSRTWVTFYLAGSDFAFDKALFRGDFVFFAEGGFFCFYFLFGPIPISLGRSSVFEFYAWLSREATFTIFALMGFMDLWVSKFVFLDRYLSMEGEVSTKTNVFFLFDVMFPIFYIRYLFPRAPFYFFFVDYMLCSSYSFFFFRVVMVLFTSVAYVHGYGLGLASGPFLGVFGVEGGYPYIHEV